LIYDIDTGRLVSTVSHAEALNNPNWSPDGQFVVATSSDRCLYVWDVRTGKQQAILRGHEYPPNATAFSHSGDLLASTGRDGTLRLWNPMTGRLLLSVPGGGDNLEPRFSPDDRRLGCTTTGSEVELQEVGSSAACRVLHVPSIDGEIHGTAFHRDGRLLASAASGSVRLWDDTSGREIARLPIGDVRSVLFHPADGGLFTSGSHGAVYWPVTADPNSPHSLRIGPPRQLLPTLDIWEMALNSDGSSLVLVAREQTRALVLHPAGGARVELGPHPQIARTAVSPDGHWVATSTFLGRQSTVKVWDAIRGQFVCDLPGEGLSGDARVAFSPDGRWLVLGTAREYRCYRVGSWQLGRTHPRERAENMPAPAAFAPDGRILAILQSPHLVQLIDVATEKELLTLTSREPQRIEHLAFSPDGTRLSAACTDGVIQVWDLRYLWQQLADLGLDQDLPSDPPARPQEGRDRAVPLRVELIHPTRVTDPRRNAQTLNNQAWRLATGPVGQRDPVRALALIEAVLKQEPGNPTFLNTLGIVQYRSGQYKEAAATLEKSLAVGQGRADAFGLFFLAMCHHRLGDAARARECYDRGIAWQKKALLIPEQVKELNGFRAEAEAVLKETKR
jgi:WD40 repeat protein